MRRSPSPTRTRLGGLGEFAGGLLRDAGATVTAWPPVKKVAVSIGVAAFVAVTVLLDVPSVATLRTWAESAGSGFIALFFLGYVVITQFPVPRTLLTLASGVLFGPWLGVAIALAATTVSAAVSLIVVRGLLGDWMRPRLTHPAVAGINERLRRRGWVSVISLRMIAAVPFSILNYAAALSSIPLGMFAVATLIGSAPGTVATVFFGDTLTGEANPAVVIVTVVLAATGVVGLVADSRLPVKPAT